LYSKLEQRLSAILNSGQLSTLAEPKIGLEKESLRVAASGGIAQTPHPRALGSALTNPYITTDFSEALTEMITPPCGSIAEALTFLDDIQKFVYSKLDDELLWATSMPCVLEGGDRIPLAQYGSSNIGTMKTVYRRGLGYRYGRTMQVIAGVHFNYSLSPGFWEMYSHIEQNTTGHQAFISESYMGLIRNMLRYGWLVPYLFGASPAVCKSFLQGKRSLLSEFNENTAYEPWATSLRMGDIGYTNNMESMVGIKANYDSLDDYIRSLRCAIQTPYDGYEQIGVKVDGEYRQLNANILQIENEYYSTVRPKQPPLDNEKPTDALARRGIQYVEIRSLDVNAFDPLGINSEQLYFLEVLVLFCLLQESPALGADEINEIDMNLIQVAHTGRKPEVDLVRCDESVRLQQWASELCDSMQGVAELLDAANGDTSHSDSLSRQQRKVMDPALTTSALMLDEMRNYHEGFFHYAQRKSMEHLNYFNARQLSADRLRLFEQAVAESWRQQLAIEQSDTVDFDTYLSRYFAQ
jgi:glutamate--cysteine ligase